MSTELLTAARIYDPVNHSKAGMGAIGGFLLGAVVGIALVVAFPVAGGLFAAFCIVGSLAVAASNVGEGLGSKAIKREGDIATGSPDTFIGHPELNAARVLDKVKCHDGAAIATGARTIHINNLPAAREKEETTCDGRIGVCCPTVLYGGPSSREAKKTHEEVPVAFQWFREIVDWVTFLSPIAIGKLTKAGKLARLLPVIRETTELAGLVKRADKLIEVFGQVTWVIEKSSKLDNAGSKWLKENVTDTPAWKVVTGGAGILGGGLAWSKQRKLPGGSP